MIIDERSQLEWSFLFVLNLPCTSNVSVATVCYKIGALKFKLPLFLLLSSIFSHLNNDFGKIVFNPSYG